MVGLKSVLAIAFIISMLSCTVFAQTRLDSLVNRLPSTTGRAQVDILNDLGLNYSSQSKGKARAYSYSALKAARELNYPLGIAQALNNVGYANLDLSQLDSARLYFIESIGVAKELNNNTALASGYNGLADYYERMDNYPESIRHHKEALALYTEENDQLGMSNAMRSIGTTLRKIGDYGRAMDYLLQSLKIDRQNKFDKKVARDLLMIAFTYINQAEGDLSLDSIALNYLREAEAMPIMQIDFSLQVDLYNYLGLVAKKKNDYDRAIYYYTKSIGACDSVGMSPVVIMQNMAVAYMSKGDFEKALEMAAIVLEMKRKIGRKSSIGFTLDLYAKTYLMMGKPELAIPYAEESMELAKSTGSPSRILQPYEFLSEAYAGLKQYDKAWELRLKYESIKDSLFNAQKSQQQTAMLSLFESEKKEQTIELQKINLALTSATNNQLIFGLGAALLMAAGLLFAFVSKTKTNNLLAKQKCEIELRDKEKEVLLKEIHHRVKNNLQIISSILNMQSRKLTDMVAKDAVDEGRSRIKSMSLIHEKLYNSNQLTVVNMKEYIEDLSGFLFKTYKPVGDIARQIDADELVLDIDTAIPVGLILNELISNALKYAFNEQDTGTLNVSFSKHEDEYMLQVADSGKGLPKDFNAIESMGMRLVNVLTEQLDGLMDIKNEAGAIITIRFKKSVLTN